MDLVECFLMKLRQSLRRGIFITISDSYLRNYLLRVQCLVKSGALGCCSVCPWAAPDSLTQKHIKTIFLTNVCCKDMILKQNYF